MKKYLEDLSVFAEKKYLQELSGKISSEVVAESTLAREKFTLRLEKILREE